MSDDTEAEALAHMSSCESEVRHEDGLPYIVLHSSYNAVSLEKYRERPVRQKGFTRLNRVESFIDFGDSMKDEDTTLYIGDGEFPTFQMIFDDFTKEKTSWQESGAAFKVEQSDQLTTWQRFNGAEMKPKDFANFIEKNRAVVITPDAGQLMDLIRDIRGKANVEFSEAIDSATGAKSIAYAEKITLKGGKNGDLEMPTGFRIGLPIYKRAETRTPIDCFLRFSIDEGKIMLRYELDLIEDIIEAVIDQLVDDVTKKLDVATFYGHPTKR